MIPASHPRVAHFMPYLVGDSMAAIARAKRLRYRYIDQNLRPDADGLVWVMHWSHLFIGRYRWTWTGRRDHKGREIRVRTRNRNVGSMSSIQVSRLRSRRRGGVQPRTLLDHLREAHRVGVTMCGELKGGPWTPKAYDYINASVRTSGADFIAMTLQSIPGWRARLAAMHTRGLPTALLPRSARPTDWAQVDLYVDAVWGRWR